MRSGGSSRAYPRGSAGNRTGASAGGTSTTHKGEGCMQPRRRLNRDGLPENREIENSFRGTTRDPSLISRREKLRHTVQIGRWLLCLHMFEASRPWGKPARQVFTKKETSGPAKTRLSGCPIGRLGRSLALVREVGITA